MFDRRQFMTAAGTAAAACLAEDAVGSSDARDFAIIDTHQHLWNLEQFRLPWLAGAPKLNKSFLPADYLRAVAELGSFTGPDGKEWKARLTKAVYMEVDVAFDQQPQEAEYVTDLCRRADVLTMAAVVSGRPARADFKQYAQRFRDSKFIKGIRQVLHTNETPAGYCLTPEFIRGIRLLGDFGLSYDLCMRPEELPDAGKLVDACPDTRFILDHCGNANVQHQDRRQWQRDIASLAKRRNIVCKVSGIVASAKPGAWTADDLAPIVNHTLDSFGPERVMFGGDWPVCTLAASYAEWVSALRAIVRERPWREQRNLFHDNALRFYALSGSVRKGV